MQKLTTDGPCPVPGTTLVSLLEETLASQGVDYQKHIDDFGQVAACETRESGQTFRLSDHIRGLILAQLSNQRPWGPIAENLPTIDKISCGYNADILQSADPGRLVAELGRIRCGNRAISAQMRSLRENIDAFRNIESEHGSIDTFVTGDSPGKIAEKLAAPGKYKLRQVGPALAFEYLRNVGIRGGKPDLHIRRILGAWSTSRRLSYRRQLDFPSFRCERLLLWGEGTGLS